MATLVAGIGVGLFILTFIWVLSIFLCLVLSRARGPLSNAGVGVMLLAAVATLVLVLLPRGPGTVDNTVVVYDNHVIGRTVLVTLCGFFILVGLVGVASSHLFEPQQAVALKTWR